MKIISLLSRLPLLTTSILPPVTAIPDVVSEPIYDSALYAAAGQTKLTFFASPLGQGTTAFGGAGGKTLVDTNHETAPTLAQGWEMSVQGISLICWSTAATQYADTQLALVGAAFQLFVGTKPWFTVPAKMLTGGAGIDGSAATAVGGTPLTIQAAHNGAADPRAIYPLREAISIKSQQGFKAELTWPNGVQAVTATIPITILLHGRKLRSM